MKQDISKCSLCGKCKAVCPIYDVTKNEADSPRGKAILLKNNKITDKILRCTNCERCELVCPSNIDFNFKRVRQEMVLNKKETNTNKQMIENIRKYGNPFGKPEKGKKPKNLYCC